MQCHLICYPLLCVISWVWFPFGSDICFNGHELCRETKQIESYHRVNQLNFTTFHAEEVDFHISKKDQLFDRNKVSELFRKPLKNSLQIGRKST